MNHKRARTHATQVILSNQADIRPICLVVLRLMIDSNFSGFSTADRQAERLFKIPSTYVWDGGFLTLAKRT
jgi:hypothetical protein